MIKFCKISCFLVVLLLFSTKIAFAEETTKFANLNDSSNTAVIVFESAKTIEDINTFSTADFISHDSFVILDDVATTIPTQFTKEVIETEVLPEISQIKDIVKTEIERQEEEKEAKIQAERLRLEENNRRARLLQTNKPKQQELPQKEIEVDTSNADGGSLESILLAQLGKPYVYGGNGPNSFDCSGLAKYVYGKIGVTLPRVASDQQHVGTTVERTIESLQFGDLVFFAPPGNTRATHVGIYVGNGQMIHAPQTGDVVKYADIFSGYYKNRFFLAKRVL